MVIVVKDIVDAADTADQGSVLFAAIFARLKATDQDITVSFRGISTATSSFVNAAFCEILNHMALAEIKERLKVKHSTAQINDMIKRRMDYEALQHA